MGSTPRRRSRRGEGEQLRAEILEAVNRLLDRWGGDEKLTMRAVAHEVGVAAPSIYLHFSDKAELVWAALSDKYTQLAQQISTASRAAADAGPRAQLRAGVHAYCRFAVENPGHYRLMYQVRQPVVDKERLGSHPARQVSNLLRSGLVASAQAGHALAQPVHQAAHTLWTGLHGMVSVQHSFAMGGSTEDLLELADGLLDLVVARERGTGAVYPPVTAVDRVIAAVVDG
ncbi:TetR/AcrR family transcriptional regulator [Mycobacterium sp. LTG2003]